MTTTLTINDMHCASCVQRVRAALTKLDGRYGSPEQPAIGRTNVNPVRRQITVEHDARVSVAALLESVQAAGFCPVLAGSSAAPKDPALLARFGVAGIAMMQVMMAQLALYAGGSQDATEPLQRLLQLTAMVFCTPVVLYSAAPLFRSALSKRSLSMDVPVALAIAIAFATSVWSTIRGIGEVYFDSVAMFTFLLLGARLIKNGIQNRLDVEADLLSALPRQVERLEPDGAVRLVNTRGITCGDRLLVREGDALPVDGRLLDERAVVEVAHLTGESDWLDAARDDTLYAGAINRGGPLQMRATSGADDSRLGALNAAAAQAAASKHHLGVQADRVARYFVPIVLLGALATWLAWHWLVPGGSADALAAALAVLVVSCPCALSLATPAAMTAAIARLLQAGMLVRTADVLERLPTLRHAVLDKTGTLTKPQLGLTSVTTHGPWSGDYCLQIAASLERGANHPIAGAFAAAAQGDLAVLGRRSEAGKGVAGSVDGFRTKLGSAEYCALDPNTTQHASDSAKGRRRSVYLSVNGQLAATFALSEVLRDDAAQVVKELARQGLRVNVQSGDTCEHVQAILAPLGLSADGARAPEDKHAYVRKLLGHGNTGGVMFVGDGLNDLSALAESDVAVATLESADLVKARSDVVLLTGELRAVLDLLNIGRRAVAVIRQNLGWALAYNLVMIPLAACGLLAPWAAALGMAGSSVFVLANASRLLRVPFLGSANGGAR